MFVGNSGYTAVARCLVRECGADMDAQTADGRTALHHACNNGHLATARVLVLQGCNLNIQNRDGYSPVMLASVIGHWRIVLLLVMARANLNLRERRFGYTAVRLACERHQMQVLRMLVHAPIVRDALERALGRPVLKIGGW